MMALADKGRAVNQPLISIIVPCYNVEKYIDKCISSIVAQTYSNLEILLINDGSTDETGTHCDMWQVKDHRIRVIHQQNQGPSYARKNALKGALGEFVAFVDADDWIDANMYTDMMAALLSTDSDIAQCDLCLVYEDGGIEHRVDKHKKNFIEKVGRIEGTLLLIEDVKWKSWLGNKIFKISLFEDIKFPKDRRCCEDFISLFLFHKASQSVYLHREYYFYFQRNDSILNTKGISAEIVRFSDFFDAYYERYLFVKQHPEYHNILSAFKYKTIYFGMSLLHNTLAYPQYFPDDSFKLQVKRLRTIPISRKDILPIRLKFHIWLLKILPLGCYKICKTLFNKGTYPVCKLRKADKNQ